MRIVSLIAAATEIVAALGRGDELVAVSHECDFPPEAVAGRVILTSPKMDISRSSLNIHKDVQAIVEKGLAVYNVDAKKLRDVKPDLIITQDQCEVCAVTYEDVVRATAQCTGCDAKIVTLHPDSLDDIFSDILKVGAALNEKEKAKSLVEKIKKKMEENSSKGNRPRVIFLEWLNPLMIAGNWIPQMIAMAGGEAGLIRDGEHTKVVTWEAIQEYDPDLIVISPCGFKISQTIENRFDLEKLPGWRDLRAVREGKVFVVDGNTYLNRPGPRILESFYILAGLFHPNLFKSLIPEGSFIAWGGGSSTKIDLAGT